MTANEVLQALRLPGRVALNSSALDDLSGPLTSVWS